MLNKLNTEERRHFKLLLFWPLFGTAFAILTWGVTLDYHVISSKLDDYIPFWEGFFVPYCFWYFLFLGFPFYTLLYDVETFKKCMKHLIITCGISILLFVIYPTQIDLRPEVFDRENIFTFCVSFLYIIDKGANVFPSLHVLTTLVIFTASWNSRRFHGAGWRVALGVCSLLIILSTVLIKQHSVLDTFFSAFLWLATCPLVYGLGFLCCSEDSDKILLLPDEEDKKP